MNPWDIIIPGFLILGAWRGYQKGLISGLISFLGSFLGFYVAVKEYLKVLGWLDQYTPLRQWLESVVYHFVLPSVQSQAQITQQQVLDRIFALIPKGLQSLVGSGAVPDIHTYTQAMVQTLANNIAGVMTDQGMRLLAFLVTFLAVILVIHVLMAILLAPLGSFRGMINRGGGFVFGVLSAFVTLAIIIGLCSPFLPLFGTDSPLALLPQASFYPSLMSVFNGLTVIFHFELTQGLQALQTLGT